MGGMLVSSHGVRVGTYLDVNTVNDSDCDTVWTCSFPPPASFSSAPCSGKTTCVDAVYLVLLTCPGEYPLVARPFPVGKRYAASVWPLRQHTVYASYGKLWCVSSVVVLSPAFPAMYFIAPPWIHASCGCCMIFLVADVDKGG